MRGFLTMLPLMAIGAPAAAQRMDHSAMPGMTMPGMKMPQKPAAQRETTRKASPKPAPARHAKPARARAAGPQRVAPANPHASHDMPAMLETNAGQPPAADPHAGHDMPGMPAMPAMPGMSMDRQPAVDPHAGHDMSSLPAMVQRGQGHDMSAMAGMKMGPGGEVKAVTDTASAPPPPTDRAADRIWGVDAMRGSLRELRREHGGSTFSMILFNLAEYQIRQGRDGYRWDGEGWYGGDIHRFVVKSEGEGMTRGGVDRAEMQALYSRTIGPYWNLQGGVRYDIRPNPSRTYATFGIEGLAPNNFDVEGFAFVSDRGDMLARVEGWYDQRLTQRLILQPRAEFNLSAQDMPRERTGSGLVDAELGLRLRYEIRREFAPYVGVSWERQYGDTARFSRARGDDTGGVGFVGGIRSWF